MSQLLKLKLKKPPGLIPCEEEDFIEDDQNPEHKKVKEEKMSKVNKISLKKVDEKKASDSHDANYALVNYKSDSATWNDNRGKDEEGGSSNMFHFGWTDILEILILCGVLFFLYQYFKKRKNKLREKKLTRNTKNLVDQMKASKECAISVPSAPPATTMAMPSASTIIPFQPTPTTMVLPAHVPTHKAISGLRALNYASNIYEPP